MKKITGIVWITLLLCGLLLAGCAKTETAPVSAETTAAAAAEAAPQAQLKSAGGSAPEAKPVKDGYYVFRNREEI